MKPPFCQMVPKWFGRGEADCHPKQEDVADEAGRTEEEEEADPGVLDQRGEDVVEEDVTPTTVDGMNDRDDTQQVETLATIGSFCRAHFFFPIYLLWLLSFLPFHPFHPFHHLSYHDLVSCFPKLP